MSSLDALATAAIDGDARALADLCAALRDPVFRLCVRMLGRPSLAEEATHDVMVKVITRLGSFEGRSAIRTWVHTIAVRHVRDLLRRRQPEPAMDEEQFTQLLEAGLSYGETQPAPSPEDHALLAEVRLSCTQGMLTILSVEQRLALVLVDLLGLNSNEAAEIAGVTAPAFRKRLSRARERLAAFLRQRCGVVEPSARCSCEAQLPAKRALGLCEARQPFTTLATGDLETAHRELRDVRTIVRAFGAQGEWRAPEGLAHRLNSLLPTVLSRG
ncbi:MAG: RNA polymerase sigma factor [Myxococcales bacterium]|nr:RNA polymerase sigma factor [Myxococcales bacterium]